MIVCLRLELGGRAALLLVSYFIVRDSLALHPSDPKTSRPFSDLDLLRSRY